jgi:hypothetical protein
MLSDNSDVRIKLFLIYFRFSALPVLMVCRISFFGEISKGWLLLMPLLLPLYWWGFLRKKKSIAVNVFISGDELHYDLDHGSHSADRSQIAQINDSGIFNGIQEMTVKLKDGGEFTFYPNKDYGSFLRRRVLKELRLWLAHPSKKAVLKNGMPELKKRPSRV